MLPRPTPLFFCASFALVLLSPEAGAQEWTRFRGPNGTGISEAKGIPSSFTEADFDWKVKLTGAGHSQPVIWDDRVFVTSAPEDGSARIISCLSAKDGEVLWEKTYPSGRFSKHDRNSFASSTPAVDGERVYAALADPEGVALVALDHTGAEKWRYGLGSYASQHGFGTSPIVHEDTVICAVHMLRRDDDPELTSFVIAIERETGHLKWKTPRRSRKAAYGTPCIYDAERDAPRLLLTSGSHGIYSLDARTGKPLWEANVFDKRTVSSPVVAAGLVFGTCGSGGGGNYLVAVRPEGEGDVTRTHALYEIRRSVPYVPTPVARGDRIYLLSDGGVATSVRASTGEAIWQHRIEGSYSGSPVWIDGRLYAISNDGDVVVIAAGDEFREIARNPLGELSRSTPAVSGGRLYLRTYSHLIAVGGKKLAGGEAGGR